MPRLRGSSEEGGEEILGRGVERREVGGEESVADAGDSFMYERCVVKEVAGCCEGVVVDINKSPAVALQFCNGSVEKREIGRGTGREDRRRWNSKGKAGGRVATEIGMPERQTGRRLSVGIECVVLVEDIPDVAGRGEGRRHDGESIEACAGGHDAAR